MQRSPIISKMEKVLSLVGSPNEHESRLAAQRLYELSKIHGVSIDCLQSRCAEATQDLLNKTCKILGIGPVRASPSWADRDMGLMERVRRAAAEKAKQQQEELYRMAQASLRAREAQEAARRVREAERQAQAEAARKAREAEAAERAKRLKKDRARRKQDNVFARMLRDPSVCPGPDFTWVREHMRTSRTGKVYSVKGFWRKRPGKTSFWDRPFKDILSACWYTDPNDPRIDDEIGGPPPMAPRMKRTA